MNHARITTKKTSIIHVNGSTDCRHLPPPPRPTNDIECAVGVESTEWSSQLDFNYTLQAVLLSNVSVAGPGLKRANQISRNTCCRWAPGQARKNKFAQVRLVLVHL